ncbi:MAG TPA: biliverdin-producing heme oxygenase [Kofleriaceae bacterium]|nr:biliverdin-producing heme oxygenase [Kofleriaceae bacterium]
MPFLHGSNVGPACTTLALDFSVVQRLSRTLIQLNIATRPHHAAADQPWLDLMAPRVERARYRALLLKVYGFEAPLDSGFRYTPELASLIDLRGRTRTGLLAQDLMRLGLTASQMAQLPQRFTTFATAAEALGWMYVIERATLLHSSVRRHLMVRCPDLAPATSYLDAYNGVTSLRWAELGAAFDSIAHTPSVLRQILNAANVGFRAMRDWFHELAMERGSRLKHSVA